MKAPSASTISGDVLFPSLDLILIPEPFGLWDLVVLFLVVLFTSGHVLLNIACMVPRVWLSRGMVYPLAPVPFVGL